MNYINVSKSLFIEADKSDNMYEVESDNYRKRMKDNVTANHTSAADEEEEREINIETKKLAEKLHISATGEKIRHKNAYIALKHNKPDSTER